MNLPAKMLKGRPHRYASWELVHRWYKSFPREYLKLLRQPEQEQLVAVPVAVLFLFMFLFLFPKLREQE